MPATQPSDRASPRTAETPAGPPLRLSRRLAAFGLFGALVVALPLIQVLRFQNAAEQTLQAARARLEPVTRTVDVERALVAHRDAAHAVLHGDADREGERELFQSDVDSGMVSLSATLSLGEWTSAAQEADAMRSDWSRLVRAVGTRGIDAAQSDDAHHLLLEECLQVIDFVGGGESALAGPGLPGAANRLTSSLPRLVALTAALSASRPQDPWQGEQAAARARLARGLGALGRDATPGASASTGLGPDGAAARAAGERLLAVLNADPHDDASVRAAGSAAMAAQFRLYDIARDEWRATLDTRLARLHRERWGLLAAMLVLGLAAAALAMFSLPRRAAAGAGAGRGLPSGNAAPRRPAFDVAGELLNRLRAGRLPPPAARRRLPQADPPPTRPGRF